MILPAIFLLATIVLIIKAITQRLCGWPRRDSEPAENPGSAPSNNTVIIIGADGPAGVIPGTKAKEVVIDLKKLDLEASASMNSSKVCSICFAHHISTKFGPCGHAFACETCAQYFLGRPCGLCRQPVDSITNVDVSSSDSIAVSEENTQEEEEEEEEEAAGESEGDRQSERREPPGSHRKTIDTLDASRSVEFGSDTETEEEEDPEEEAASEDES